MELFELTKIMFECPTEYEKVTLGVKRKHFFMVNRRLAIQFPLQAQLLQHVRIDEASVINFWQSFLRKQYVKTPYWMFIKGVKKTKETKEKKANVKESLIKEFATKHGYDIKIIREALEFFPEQMKKEILKFEKITKS